MTRPEYNTPLDALRYHVSGAIARGEAEPIVGIPAPVPAEPVLPCGSVACRECGAPAKSNGHCEACDVPEPGDNPGYHCEGVDTPPEVITPARINPGRIPRHELSNAFRLARICQHAWIGGADGAGLGLRYDILAGCS